MRKSDILAALERMPGDPEIEVRAFGLGKASCPVCDTPVFREIADFQIDRINEYPRPEIVVIEK